MLLPTDQILLDMTVQIKLNFFTAIRMNFTVPIKHSAQVINTNETKQAGTELCQAKHRLS